MNAGSVWIGHEYAYVDFVRRGVIPMSAMRVKVLAKREAQDFYKKRKDTLVTVEFLESERLNREVNVRNLYDFWDSYTDERSAAVARREAAQAERERRWEEQERERLERVAERERVLEQKRQKLEHIRQGLAAALSIDPSAIETDSTNEWLKINVKHLAFLENHVAS
jgi:hypothetical protein